MPRSPVTTGGTLEEGYETYAGDRAYLQGTWPGARMDAQEHAHYLPCGGERAHVHTGGSQPHTHRHMVRGRERCQECQTYGMGAH